ncbi:MAG: hypothetical protein KatS3mg087_1318 [Patescibacteria group bacterium]|nr:MAG: hypothetical protein KatS3mg087_1318 [Patescibacteria group bacterium]
MPKKVSKRLKFLRKLVPNERAFYAVLKHNWEELGGLVTKYGGSISNPGIPDIELLYKDFIIRAEIKSVLNRIAKGPVDLLSMLNPYQRMTLLKYAQYNPKPKHIQCGLLSIVIVNPTKEYELFAISYLPCTKIGILDKHAQKSNNFIYWDPKTPKDFIIPGLLNLFNLKDLNAEEEPEKWWNL